MILWSTKACNFYGDDKLFSFNVQKYDITRDCDCKDGTVIMKMWVHNYVCLQLLHGISSIGFINTVMCNMD